jgi:DNA-directed RNA polymerase subunit RPC12/RpoP
MTEIMAANTADVPAASRTDTDSPRTSYRCGRCGYPRVEPISARCPECGGRQFVSGPPTVTPVPRWLWLAGGITIGVGCGVVYVERETAGLGSTVLRNTPLGGTLVLLGFLVLVNTEVVAKHARGPWRRRVLMHVLGSFCMVAPASLLTGIVQWVASL